MIFIVFSCSTKQEKKSNFKSKNNFLAYYNTYFMAEKNFNDALEIIQSNINQDKAVMQQADKLLDLAIENALIIEFITLIQLRDVSLIEGRIETDIQP